MARFALRREALRRWRRRHLLDELVGVVLLQRGRQLGFELLAADFGLVGCSWLCNGLETRLAIPLNEHGFIATAGEAERGVREISGGAVAAEPGLWLPWRIIEHA